MLTASQQCSFSPNGKYFVFTFNFRYSFHLQDVFTKYLVVSHENEFFLPSVHRIITNVTVVMFSLPYFKLNLKTQRNIYTGNL